MKIEREIEITATSVLLDGQPVQVQQSGEKRNMLDEAGRLNHANIHDIKKLSVKEREDWMILDDQFFTFHNLSRVYAVTDLMRL